MNPLNINPLKTQDTHPMEIPNSQACKVSVPISEQGEHCLYANFCLPAGLFWQLADRVLQGHRLTSDEAATILHCADENLPELVAAAHRIRHQFFGRRVQLNVLINAKSGYCPEDCSYCSQSRISRAEINKYDLLDDEHILAGAELAHDRQAKTYCIVLSGRKPRERDLKALERIVPEIRQRWGLQICISAGFLSPSEAKRLKDCGVNRVNHNLNTSERFYPQICTTHLYEDRLATLRAVREAGLELCSGGIIGMGESPEDVATLALTLAEFQPEAVPINFLIPIPGTPLEADWNLNPRYCLKVLCLFRFALPRTELRIAAGRELHLRSLQPLGLWVANSIFVGDYLTTKGQAPEADYQMLQDLGLEPEIDGSTVPGHDTA